MSYFDSILLHINKGASARFGPFMLTELSDAEIQVSVKFATLEKSIVLRRTPFLAFDGWSLRCSNSSTYIPATPGLGEKQLGQLLELHQAEYRSSAAKVIEHVFKAYQAKGLITKTGDFESYCSHAVAVLTSDWPFTHVLIGDDFVQFNNSLKGTIPGRFSLEKGAQWIVDWARGKCPDTEYTERFLTELGELLTDNHRQ